MLVLSRKWREVVILRDRVTGEVIAEVAVVECRPDRCRLGFTAGENVEIMRLELVEEQDGKREA